MYSIHQNKYIKKRKTFMLSTLVYNICAYIYKQFKAKFICQNASINIVLAHSISFF